MVFSDSELLESGYIVRESENNDEAHSCSVDLLYPEVTPVKNSSGLQTEVSESSNNNHLRSDLVTTSIDHDPVSPSTIPCTTSLSSEDLFQVEEENENNEPNGFGVQLEDGKSSALGEDAMDSPSIQTMERDGDYDPNRIPSSVFATTDSVNPGDWSAASNESLFSLHGGVSFGRDQAVMLSAESRKVRDWQRSQDLTKIDELTVNPPLASVESDDSEVEEKELVKDETKEDVEKTHPSDEQSVKPLSAISRSSISGRSDGSEGSTFSFAFPILAPGRSSTKRDASTRQTSHYREAHLEPEPYTPAAPPQQPSASKPRKFSCFSFCSLSSFCSCSSCPRPSCSSCWPFKSRSR